MRFQTLLLGCLAASSACDGPRSSSDALRAIASRLSADGGADSGVPIVESKIAIADSSAFGTAVATGGDVLVTTAPRTTVGANASAGVASVFVREPGDRTFRLLKAGSIVNVVLANKAYQGGGTTSAKVEVHVPG